MYTLLRSGDLVKNAVVNLKKEISNFIYRFLKQYFHKTIRHFSCRYLPEGNCSNSNRRVRSIAYMHTGLPKSIWYLVYWYLVFDIRFRFSRVLHSLFCNSLNPYSVWPHIAQCGCPICCRPMHYSLSDPINISKQT